MSIRVKRNLPTRSNVPTIKADTKKTLRIKSEMQAQKKKIDFPGMLNYKPNTFIFKLFRTLQDKCNQSYIFWLPCGNGIGFYLNDEFKTNILEQIFKCTNEHSFIRQLHLYGFSKVERATKNSDKIKNLQSYQHPNFVRDRSDLLFQITRKEKTKKLTIDLSQLQFSWDPNTGSNFSNFPQFPSPAPSSLPAMSPRPSDFSPTPSFHGSDVGLESSVGIMQELNDHISQLGIQFNGFQNTQDTQASFFSGVSPNLNLEFFNSPLENGIENAFSQSSFPFLTYDASLFAPQMPQMIYAQEPQLQTVLPIFPDYYYTLSK